jgi:hypothetical protein
MLTRSKAVRVAAFIDAPPSPLSDPPSDEEFEVQEQINNDRLAREQEQSASDNVQMADDADAVPRTPRKTYRVRDIESELNLTRGQGDQLLTVIDDEMKKADILGNINFHPKTKAQHEGALRQVIETAKRDLTFLGEKGVEEDRLDELLMLRAHICNANEKHNEFMVSSGKVKARASGVDRTASAAASDSVHEDDIQYELAAALFDEDDDAPIAARTRARSEARLTSPTPVRRRDGSADPTAAGDAPIATRTRARSEARPERATTPTPIRRRQRSNATKSTGRPSVVARHLRNLNIGAVTQQEDEAPAIRTHFNTSIFSFILTAFLIRIINSTTGAAIRTSFLLPPSLTGIGDLSFEAFIETVTQQVGFDVRGRISAVVGSTKMMLGSRLRGRRHGRLLCSFGRMGENGVVYYGAFS